MKVSMNVNGRAVSGEVEGRTLNLAISPEYDGLLTGTAMVRYYEEQNGKRVLLAEQPVTLG